MNTTHQTTSDVLTRKQAAEYLPLSKGTLDKLDIPRIQIRRRVVYKKADIDAWLETQKVGGRRHDRGSQKTKSQWHSRAVN
jgi:predicted DNA-binding transcriptional regulator AlpA